MAVTKIPKKTVTLIEPKRSFIVDKAQHRQKRVAAYCRVSTDSEEQLTSYTNQMKVYTEMIASNKEWEFAGLYADEGISGTRADKRPQFQKMIEDCHKGKIDMIITKSVSRFARNTVDCLDYVRSLKEIGVGIYFEEQNIDTLKSDSELYLVIYAGFAQSESESISKNITWTHRKNFEDGKPIFMYSRMLGYRKGEDGNPEIVPEEAAIVQRVFDMYLSGKSTDEISEILQVEEIVIPGKKLTFSKSMIIRMLKNEKYCRATSSGFPEGLRYRSQARGIVCRVSVPGLCRYHFPAAHTSECFEDSRRIAPQVPSATSRGSHGFA